MTEKLRIIPTDEEQLLLFSYRACSKDNRQHLFWLTVALAKRNTGAQKPAQAQPADVILLADPLRKFR